MAMQVWHGTATLHARIRDLLARQSPREMSSARPGRQRRRVVWIGRISPRRCYLCDRSVSIGRAVWTLDEYVVVVCRRCLDDEEVRHAR